MAKSSPASQLTLSLFDSTAISSLTLDGGTVSVPASAAGSGDEPDDTPPAAPAVAAPRPRNWRLAGPRALAATWKERAADNVAAIRLLHAVEAGEGAASPAHHATADEQEKLSRFVAFGASELANTCFRRAGEAFRPDWEEIGTALEREVSAEEMAGLQRATQYAHFTPTWMVGAIWDALERMGFSGGRVLEPGCGTGLFMAALPEAAAPRTALTGIEADPVTARIAKLLFPDAWIRCEDFTKSRLTERFDVVVGNPPFSDRTVRADDPAGRLGLSLHDFFIARSVERLREGGVAVFVTSRWTLDKTTPTAREHIAGLADLLGAVRLPQGAMRAEAGTDVVVDVLVLRRRGPGQAGNGVAWDSLAAVLPAEDGEDALCANRYFAEHPEMVLGRHAWTTGPYGPAYTCEPCPAASATLAPAASATLAERLRAALALVATGVRVPAPEQVTADQPKAPRLVVGTAAEGATVKEGSFVLLGDRLHQVVDGAPVPVTVRSAACKEGIFAKHARILRALVPVRDLVRAVLRAQEANEPWGALQTRLRIAYQGFVRQFGPINMTTISTGTDPRTGEAREVQRRPNLQPFLDDPDCWLVASVELYDADSNTARMGPVFTERVIHPPAEPVIDSAADALAVTLHEVGHVDLARVAELLGRSREEAVAELGDAVFRNPALSTTGLEVWETADAYLSGQVRTKLAVAEAAATLDPSLARNVEALRGVQPPDLPPSDITARLGAPWIPAEVVAAFSREVIGIATVVRHTVDIAAWSLDVDAFAGQAAATSQWGTARRHAGFLLLDALNASVPEIFDTWRDSDGEHRELNTVETEAAKEKLAAIKAAFERWVWTDVERADRLALVYNDRFNNLVPRAFDGRHLRLPGSASTVQLREHQKRAIWRIISAGSTYLAHAVGAGKTFAMVAAIMEQKRLGLISKAMMVVPGHCLAQASREFLQLYPNARILVADETNFVKDKRSRFLARAATATWDAILITHSAFKFIATPAAFEQALVQQQLDSYGDLLERVDGEDRITRKRIERLKEGLEAKLDALAARKDDMLTIAEIGVDQLVVDEAQEFRKLSFATNMTTIKGVAPDGSQRAWDLWVKSRFIAQFQPARALVMASGSPISNTLGELYTLGRFMQPELLEERGVHQFDAWASSFGDTRTELELQPSGKYKPVTRFAEFVNVPELIAMFRTVADVALKDDLRRFMTLPAIAGGKRQIVTAPASPAFRAYQRILDERIHLIETRKGKPNKGDDILLSVITDGRHAAIDMRFVLPPDEADPLAGNEPGNKLNALIGNVHRIWRDSTERRFLRPDGQPYAARGAAQMIFSDLGTEAAESTRGFSAYRWIKQELVRLGVPAGEIAFMQDHKRSAAKQALFNDVNAGKVRVLLGSTQTMGTGVNAQARLAALHHLDVPWLPSDIEQREGRIERQGNQNAEIGIYAYATLGSVDATSWQLLERKARFIAAALAGDRSIRRLEDVGSQTNQFALAKALASGDPRLMHKAGLEAEVARLRRLRAAHWDDQHAIGRQINAARQGAAAARQRIDDIGQDLARRTPTRGDAFAMEVGGKRHSERKTAGALLLSRIRLAERALQEGVSTAARIGGFALMMEGRRGPAERFRQDLWLAREGFEQPVEVADDLTALGLVSRLEYMLERFEVELAEERRHLADAEARLPGYQARVGEAFAFETELEDKEAELKALEADLAANDNRDRDAAPAGSAS